MSRFTRYSRISPLALCLERERLAWRCGAGLFLLFLALAAGALFCPTPAGFRVGAAGADFTGFLVGELRPPPARPAAEKRAPMPVPSAPGVEPEVALAPPEPQFALEPLFAPTPDWEESEPMDGEPLLVLELPESLARPSAPRPRVSESAASADGQLSPPGELVAASYRTAPRPPYPPALLSRRVQGRVGLRIFVDAEGVPQEVEVSSTSGHAAFDRRAREWALAHWRFHPARRGGVAVASIVRTQVEFVLR